MLKPFVNVGILREPAVSATQLFADVVHPEHRSFSERQQAERVDALTDRLHELIQEASRQAQVPVSIETYQIHPETQRTIVFGRKRARHILQNDILAAVDPSASVFAFATKPRRQKPLQRGVAAFTERDEWEAVRPLVSAQRVPLAEQSEEGRRRVVSRIFSLHLPLDPDDQKKQEGVALATLRHALLYPDLPMIDAVYSNAVGIIDEDHPLAKPENRHLLSEAQDSEDEENGV